LRQLLFEENSIGVFGDAEDSNGGNGGGNGSPNAKKINKLTNKQVQEMVKEVDKSHNNGSTVTCNVIKNYINSKFNVDIHISSIASYFKSLGLAYKPIKARKRNTGSYRMDL
jgi:transposase